MEYLHEDKKRFREAVDLTAYQTGAAPEAIEKDYYVTLILRLLSRQLSFIVFKGGTSLSKCCQLIKRFSEDIDITIDTSISQGQRCVKPGAPLPSARLRKMESTSPGFFKKSWMNRCTRLIMKH